MAVTAYWYGNAMKALMNKEIDLDDGNVKVMLTTSTYTPDQDAHDYKDDVTNEVTGTGYVAGGTALSGGTVVYTGATNVCSFDANDVTWSNSTITARRAVIYYDNGGSAAVSPLISYVDFGQDEVSSNGDFTITWHADGICKVTVS